MFYIRIFLMLLAAVFSALICLTAILFRPFNTNNNRIFLRLFAPIARAICGIRLEVEGRENLDPVEPVIYIGNHQSALDALTFGSLCPKKTIIFGKRSIILIPLIGQVFWLCGNILLHRSDGQKAHAQIEQGVEAIRNRGASLAVFPEGKRNFAGDGLLPFKKGAFLMAIKAGVNIVPIVSSSLNEVAHWGKKKISGGTVRMKILQPVSTKGLESGRANELCTRVRDQMAAAFAEIS